MNIKVFAFVLTLILVAFGGYFIVQYYQTCYTCNPALSQAMSDEFDKPDLIFAMINFAVAILSIYLITIRKFNISAIVSGVVAGLQVVAVGTILFLTS
jgi:hypothetical protein